MENQFISNPSSRIALFGHKQDTEILQKASEHSQCAMIPTLGDKWLQSPEFYGLNDTLRDTLIEESLAQNLIIVETPELKVYALPVFFSFRWISSPNVPYIKDEIMDFLALILNRYLQFKQEYYLDVKDVMDGLGRYRFQWDNRLYDDLNESYFRMYKVQDVIRNIA
ncbi:hypothetical protein GX51_03663 [Blastomyces parvus]|uniref:Uncharacterized protein n=1 Tax=Blastomyces parvus TaxID=2060905 RepID=A0A2B7X519_9EURO|nr:hypothetical protein GX51_03663 [Blastomyces parvus]